MKINNTKTTVPGVYIYADDVVFTKNDFVISGSTIYICTPKPGKTEVIGEDPEKSENFTIYLGDQSMDLSEYLSFLENLEGKNKYLSVKMLQAVLNSFMLGIDGKGIIGDFIYYDPETFEVKLRGRDQGTVYTDPYSVLADIMMDPSINHATLRVSRLLPEIYVYVSNPGLNGISKTDQKSCILKQYTYLQEGTGNRIRVQELIDPVDGLFYYRSANIDEVTITSSTPFKCSVVNAHALRDKATNIFALYNARLKVMKSLEEHLKSNFRYKNYPIDVASKPTNVVLESSRFLDGYGEVTILISEVIDSGLRSNHEVTINLMDYDVISGDEKTWPEYYITDNLTLVPNQSASGDINLVLSGNDNAWISGVYYREYYGV